MSGRSCCESPRLEHDNSLSTKPRFVNEAKRHERGLAGAWGSNEHSRTACFERSGDIANDFGDGQVVGLVGVRTQEVALIKPARACP